MRREILSIITNPMMPSNENDLVLYEFESADKDRIKDGILYSLQEDTWFAITDEITELINPELMYDRDRDLFFQKYTCKFKEYGIDIISKKKKTGSSLSNQIEQRKHYDAFSNDKDFNYDDYENLPFWKGVFRKVYSKWKSKVKEGDWILDVGCGTGSSINAIAKENVKIVGIDISKQSVTKAVERSKRNKQYENQSFFISDAGRLPFKDNVFNFAITSGVLSQVPDPSLTIKEIQRVLKPGGIHFGLENNRSVFRVFFDIIVRFSNSWKKNKKGNVPEVNHKMLAGWLGKDTAEINSYTSIFLPPMYFNRMDEETVFKKIISTDKLFYKIPFFRKNGGLVIFEIKKI